MHWKTRPPALQRAQCWLALLLPGWVGAQRSCAQRYFCLVASTQAAPLAMIYDDLGLFCKHSPNQGGSYIPRVFLHGWDCSKIILLVLHCKSSEVVGPRTGAG